MKLDHLAGRSVACAVLAMATARVPLAAASRSEVLVVRYQGARFVPLGEDWRGLAPEGTSEARVGWEVVGRHLLKLPHGSELGPLAREMFWTGLVTRGRVAVATTKDRFRVGRLGYFAVAAGDEYHLRCDSDEDCILITLQAGPGNPVVPPYDGEIPSRALDLGTLAFQDDKGTERAELPPGLLVQLGPDLLDIVRLQPGPGSPRACGGTGQPGGHRAGFVLLGTALVTVGGKLVEVPGDSYFRVPPVAAECGCVGPETCLLLVPRLR